jgi:aminoglycoside phosphotransferase (APT) family kinase protein
VLGQAELVRHLLGAALLDEGMILGGDLRVEEVPARHYCLKLHSNSGCCFFVKQARTPEATASMAHEAAAYTYLSSRNDSPSLRDALLRLRRHDESSGLLVFELSPGSVTLREVHSKGARCSHAAAATLGRALAELHRLPLPQADVAPSCRDGAPAPALSVHRPAATILQDASRATLAMIATIQRFPAFGSLLDELRAEWKPSSLIHSDLKSSHYILDPRPSVRGHDLKIIDWETWRLGDPGWDVGSVFSDYLSTWLFSIPVLPHGSLDRFLETARCPLERMAPEIASFWRAYAGELGLAPDEARDRLLRSTRYAAGRLLQEVFERMQGAQRLTSHAVRLLQLSWNILQRPGETATHLLGLAV